VQCLWCRPGGIALCSVAAALPIQVPHTWSAVPQDRLIGPVEAIGCDAILTVQLYICSDSVKMAGLDETENPIVL